MQIYVGDECFDIVKETRTRVTDSAGRVWYKPNKDGWLSRYGGERDGISNAVTTERHDRKLQEKAELSRKQRIDNLSYVAGMQTGWSSMYPRKVTLEEVSAKIEALAYQLAAAKELEALLKGENV